MADSRRRRYGIAAVWTAVVNGHLAGFVSGRLYRGPLKNCCVPGLNCYSCPGALGACPIGALQAVLGSRRFGFSYYVVGFLLMTGAILGRLVCGFLCPFGLVQELLYRIPFPKKIKTFRGDRALRRVKYVVLVVFVILLPLFAVDIVGQGGPAFCKWICPAGTLEGGIPLVLANPVLRAATGWLYRWKLLLLAGTVLISVVIFRPFCRYGCPLGAIYSLFASVSLYRYTVDTTRCTACGACKTACGMALDPMREPNSPECIRCGDCKAACPHGAIRAGFCGQTVRRQGKAPE